MTELVGWFSSLVLLATVVIQIRKQWRERSGRGVSIWLFIGQAGASLGFTLYSVLVKNWVFTVTNALMFVSALVGWYLTRRFNARGAPNQTTERALDVSAQA
jgi:uncharacterized protein with PQ loop repeat